MGCDPGPGALAIRHQARKDREASTADELGVRYVDQLVEQLDTAPSVTSAVMRFEDTGHEFSPLWLSEDIRNLHCSFIVPRKTVREIQAESARERLEQFGVTFDDDTFVAQMPELRGEVLQVPSSEWLSSIRAHAPQPLGPGGPTLLLRYGSKSPAASVHARVEAERLVLTVPNGQMVVNGLTRFWGRSFVAAITRVRSV